VCLIALASVGLGFLVSITYCQEFQTASKWDRALLGLELRNVHIEAKHLKEALQLGIGKRLGVRTVFFWNPQDAGAGAELGGFRFESDHCKVADVLASLEHNYPSYTTTQDKETGIIWLHPRSSAYENILTNLVKVPTAAVAVPMESVILEKLVPFNVSSGGRHGTSALNTFEYPVDVPAGTYPVRSLLNICCLANPDRTFYVTRMRTGTHVVYPLTVVAYDPDVHEATPGALLYWQNEIDPSAGTPPNGAQMLDALSSTEPAVRAAARHYVNMTLSVTPLDDLIQEPASAERAAWAAIAYFSLMARTDNGSYVPRPVKQKLEKALREGDWSTNRGLRVLAEVELSRVSKDTALLDRASEMALSSTETANIKHDVIRNLRSSEFLRNELAKRNLKWEGLSREELEFAGRPDVLTKAN
jgi:hypothetical protein